MEIHIIDKVKIISYVRQKPFKILFQQLKNDEIGKSDGLHVHFSRPSYLSGRWMGSLECGIGELDGVLWQHGPYEQLGYIPGLPGKA
jgi:hypothetical protein